MAAFLIAGVPGFVGAQTSPATTFVSRPKPIPRPTPKPKPTPTPAPTPVDARRDWGNTGTDFNTNANWSAGTGGVAPGAGDVAWFTTVVVTQPNLSASVNIAGLNFSSTGSSGYNITNSNSATFTLTANQSAIGLETTHTDSVAIAGQNTSGTNSISVPIVLAPISGTTSTFSQSGGGTLIVNGDISGTSINLNILGGGTIQLGGSNSYGGTTAVSGGTTLNLTGSNSSTGATTLSGASTRLSLGLGTNGGLASGLLTLGGSTRIQSTDSTARTISNSVAITGNVTFGASSPNTGAMTFNGTVDLTGSTRTVTVTSDTTFANTVLSSTGANIGLTKGGSGILTFSGSTANTYDGVTTVNTGELDLNKTAGVNAIAGNLSIGDGAGTDTVKLLADNQIANTSDVTISASGVLNLNGKLETIDGLTGGTSTAVTLGAGTLTVGANNEANLTFAGIISGTGGNLIKTGTGTQILTGNNSYTGETTIDGGILNINNGNSASLGRLSGTSGITVSAGGTLLFSGSSSWTDRINDSSANGFTLAGGKLDTGGLSERGGTIAAPTAGIGALTLTLTSTIDFGATNTSVIEFAGLGTHTDITVLQITNWNGDPNAGGTGDRLLFAGSTGSFLGLYDQEEVSFNGAFGYNIYQFSGFYEVTAVPEPSTWIGGSLALAALAYSQRRRLKMTLSGAAGDDAKHYQERDLKRAIEKIKR